jgi:hypothetical protein
MKKRDGKGKDLSAGIGRREFLVSVPGIPLGIGMAMKKAGAASVALVSPEKLPSSGPGHGAIPKMKAVFVRRKEGYDFLWPGAGYDGVAAHRSYTEQIRKAAAEIGIDMEIQEQVIHDMAQADRFAASVKEEKCDGALVVLLDRQKHAWPTAAKVSETGIHAVIFAPIGTAFTTNVKPLARKPKVFVISSSDFDAVRYGMKMIKAAKQMRHSRLVILKGEQEKDAAVENLGTKLRTLPLQTFVRLYREIGVTDEVEKIARDYTSRAKKVVEPTPDDVRNAAKTYVVAQRILKEENADAITMDCLGPASRREIPVPCLAWAKLNDEGISAGCEADLYPTLTLMLVRYLFDKPGFQQDPVPETVQKALIGSHCVCATRLDGFSKPPAPFNLRSHHSDTGVTVRPIWRKGQRVTIAQLMGADKMLIQSGTVLDNVWSPPAGGCRTAVAVKLDNVSDVTQFPGFHQIFFYGDHARELRAYCQMFGIEPVEVS